MHLRRSSNSADGHSVASSPSFSLSSTKRRFPLLSRRKNRHSDVSQSSIPPVSSQPSSPSPTQKVEKPGLRVHIQIKFETPHASEHVRDYESSSQFKATDRICQALLSRLQHCSSELITRHDSNALDPLRKPHRDVKPLRYRITYCVEREGLVLIEKSLRSFQEFELTHDDAREVVAATDRIIGLFLVRHDPGFRWSEPSETEVASPESETFRPCTGRPQSLACIPRSHFVHKSQNFEFISGYSVELFLRSRCATRYPENRNASIKIDSRQPSPLPLLLGEELTTRVSNLIIDPVDAWKRKFDKRHKSCTGLEGSGGCSHIEDGAVDIMVKVRNHIGPDYTYLSHRIQTSKVLFNDHDGRDFDEFANQVKAKLEKARDMTDKSMRSLDDLTLTIRELRGKNWSVHEPLVVRLDPTITYCRQTMEAVMERFQTGISNVLEHHEDALATLTIHKRGQLIFDGFLDGAGGGDNVHYEKFATPDLERKALEAHLKERIRSDITMLCKDTCAVDCPDTLPNLRFKINGAAASHIGAGVSRPPLSTAGSSSAAPTTPSLAASPLPRQPSQASFNGSFASTRSDNTLAKKVAMQNLRDSAEPPSPVTPSYDLRRVPSGVEMAKKHGYMSDFMVEDENQSEPPSTPSLADTDSISPRDSVIVTPSRVTPHDQSNEGLRIVEDGRRIIYHEQSDMDAIASGMVEFHRPITDDDEPIQLTKEKHGEIPDNKVTRQSLDSPLPSLPRNADLHSKSREKELNVSREEPESKIPMTLEHQKANTTDEKLLDKSAPEHPPKQEAEGAGRNDIVQAPQKVEPIQDQANAYEETEITRNSQGSQWELVEAVEAPREYAAEVGAISKSETSFGTTPAASIRDDTETKEITTPDVLVSTAAQEQLPQQGEEEAQTFNDSEVQTPKADPVVAETSDIPHIEAAQEAHDISVLTYFPKPPSIHSQTEDPSELPQVDSALISEGATAPSDSSISAEEEPKDKESQTPPVMEHIEGTPSPSYAKSSARPSMAVDTKEKEERHAQAADMEVESFPEMVTHFLETVPEDTLLEPTATVAEDIQVISTESPESQEVPTSLDERPYMPTIASAPPERLPLQQDFFPSTEEKEEGQESSRKSYNMSDFSDALSRPRARPRTNTLPERRYSTALALEIDLSAHHDPDDEEDSAIDDAPKSANGTWRPYTLHNRQPSAGFIGLPEQRRLHSVGLRSAVLPYRWQQMRREQAIWEGRPGTSHSEA
ncbi:Ff.00g093580.m01.CDS01 [Fusarium sp. VM40]|nr:Ff.00g093580.m01.CDS01 [Fusarium sp. VM40]